jgi:hypothetical protein
MADTTGNHGVLVVRRVAIAGHGNPIFAVLLSWRLSVGLIMIGGFEFLLNLSIFFTYSYM